MPVSLCKEKDIKDATAKAAAILDEIKRQEKTGPGSFNDLLGEFQRDYVPVCACHQKSTQSGATRGNGRRDSAPHTGSSAGKWGGPGVWWCGGVV